MIFDLLFWIAVFLDLLAGAGWIALLVYDARELSSYHNFRLVGASTANDEMVSVIIPARNEEEKIARCLQSMAGQTHRNLEIVAVDDRSTDKTSEIIAAIEKNEGRVRLVHGEELPEGWVGKNWACHQGFRVSRGEWLLFVDSDCVLARDALERTLSYSKRKRKDALSIFPKVEIRGFWSLVVWPFLSSVIRLLYPLRGVNSPTGRSALVFGAFILIKRSAYDKIGGHKMVKQDAVEDKQIGNNMKSMGVPYEVLIDGTVLTASLPSEFKEIWNSIRRIASNPLRNRRLTGLAFVIAGLVSLAYPMLALGAELVTGSVINLFVVTAAISVLAPAAIVTYDVHNTTSRSYAHALLAFVAGTLIMLGILRQIIWAPNYSWRGRTYKAQNREAIEDG